MIRVRVLFCHNNLKYLKLYCFSILDLDPWSSGGVLETINDK